MRFVAESDYGTVLTDDYSVKEIKKKIHIKNIINSFKKFVNHPCCAWIYNENGEFVTFIYLGDF